MNPPKPSSSASSKGADTQQKIIDATLTTLRTQGIAGTSARAIAREGDFNQALIFYHFGDLNTAVLAAVSSLNAAHAERYAERLADATSLIDLVEIASQLHQEDRTSGSVSVFTQAAAGAQGNPDMGRSLYAQLEQWSGVIEHAIGRCVAEQPALQALPASQISFAIMALFMGIEILSDLDPESAPVDETLATLRSLAQVGELLLQAPLLQGLTSPN